MHPVIGVIVGKRVAGWPTPASSRLEVIMLPVAYAIPIASQITAQVVAAAAREVSDLVRAQSLEARVQERIQVGQAAEALASKEAERQEDRLEAATALHESQARTVIKTAELRDHAGDQAADCGDITALLRLCDLSLTAAAHCAKR
jgi:hypothetical protein